MPWQIWMMNRLWSIELTHKTTDIEEVGKFHVADTEWKSRLGALKDKMGMEELCYLSTCNRVEFFVVTHRHVDTDYLQEFVATFNPTWSSDEVEHYAGKLETHQGEHALHHLLSVASSIDSMVIGEREIITQVRSAYEKCYELGLTGDLLRIIFRKTIETAKAVYTQTEIARKPVSVVSLAYRKLRELNVALNARILVVGTGQTNTTMTRFLSKHGYTNFNVFNRTLKNAEEMAAELRAEVHAIDALASYKGGFEVILTCTGSSDPIITKEIYANLLQGDNDRKVVIDLAVPNDFDTSIAKEHKVTLISVDELKKVAEENLHARANELEKCRAIIEENLNDFRKVYKRRQVELVMSDIPRKVHEIRKTAVEDVFVKELSGLDTSTKEVLDKVIDYLEQKYISVPMKMAKEILLDREDLK